MSFQSLVIGSSNYNSAGDGRYVKSTVTFGNPSDHIVIKGGALSKDRRNYVAALTTVLEKDVEQNGTTTRRPCTVQVIITVPTSGFTAADVDARIADISTLVDQTFLNRLLAGES